MVFKKNEKQKYYTHYDLAQGNTITKAYFSLFSEIYDLTNLLEQKRETVEGDNMLDWVGKDISHLFNSKTKLPIVQNPYLQKIRSKNQKDKQKLIHFNLEDCERQNEIPWFKNRSLVIGLLTKREIKVKLVNIISYSEDVLIVPIEETLNEICNRYLFINSHARSYMWKDINGRVLNMNLNLLENEMEENLEEIEYLDIPEEEVYIPTIFLHFKDDLTMM